MDFENNDMEGLDEELDNIIILNDEDGNEVQFEFLDLIELDGEEYVVLLPTEGEEDEDGEVVILKVEDTDDDSEEESYVSVEDEEILNKVFEINIVDILVTLLTFQLLISWLNEFALLNILDIFNTFPNVDVFPTVLLSQLDNGWEKAVAV